MNKYNIQFSGMARLLNLLLLLVIFNISTPTKAGYESYNSDEWLAHDETSSRVIDHSLWDKILQKYVKTDQNGFNRFEYSSVPPAERRALGHYLEELSNIEVSQLNRAEQLAYWINLYNASMVSLILRHYPIKSVLQIGRKLTSRGPWNIKLYRIEDKIVTLGMIEKGIVHSIWNDPRLYYSLSCAAIGCGNLVKKAFTAENTEELLEKNALNFVNSDRAILKKYGPKIKISKMYKWYWKSFDGEEGIIQHLRKYARGMTSKALEGTVQISSYDFNWYLNDYK